MLLQQLSLVPFLNNNSHVNNANEETEEYIDVYKGNASLY
jgi:hypothetical protein